MNPAESQSYAHYFSNVLPELVEESVAEIGMEPLHRGGQGGGDQRGHPVQPRHHPGRATHAAQCHQEDEPHEHPANIYKAFYDWLGRPEPFKPAKGGKLEYADVFPLIYLQLHLEGIDNPHKAVKHLLIDEMQGYTPVQYAVIARLFPCRKTILGDVSQSVNPYSASQAQDIQRAFSGAGYVTLNRSYRSTLQVMQFARHICPNPDLVPMERHGLPPRVLACGSRAEELAKDGIRARLRDPSSAAFSGGITVCTAHLANGLEFDRVIVPEANAATYHTPMDRNLLYVACTRAMHELVLTHTAEPSAFLPG